MKGLAVDKSRWSGRNGRLGVALLALGTSAWAQSQEQRKAATRCTECAPHMLIISSAPASKEMGAAAQIVREIVDPQNGKRWVLMRGSGHTGGPGRLVLAGDTNAVPPSADSDLPSSRPVIRAGDRVVVEEHTRRVDARLEAVALGSAAAGSALNVRLTAGAKVVRAVALEPGRAALRPETGGRP